jgi:hypothetical protein
VTTAAHAPFVMTAPRALTALIAPLGTNMPSAMVGPFAKDVTWTPRANSTVRFELLGMSDATSVPLAMIAPRATIVRHVTTALPPDRAPRATTVHPERIAPIVPSAPLVTTVRHEMTVSRVTTVAQLVTTVRHEMTVSRVTTVRHVTTVPPAATRISILLETRRRSTSPAKTSYSSVFRRWPLRPMTSMV